MKPLVSIIVPCYNSERYIFRLLDSILIQSYESIELIVINDGSTDSTEKIIMKYKEKFEESKKKFIYRYQNNQGQAAAINNGLECISGKYFCWIDSDDFLHKNSIEKRVNLLKNAGKGFFCISACDVVNEENIECVVRKKYRKKPLGEDNYFIDAILDKNVVFLSGGGFMINTSDFWKVCKTRKIFPSRAGQNWQLMLPIIYNYKCIYIEESLYTVVERGNSHSRSYRTKNEKIYRAETFNVLLKTVVKEMEIEEEQQILELIDKKYKMQMLKIALMYGDNDLSNNIYSDWRKNYKVTAKAWVMHLASACIITRKFICECYKKNYIDSILKRLKNARK